MSARHPGSVLLLTVMIIAVLTTTTLGAIAIRFDQLSATEKINNSAVAKLAADSGLAKVKEKLTAGASIVPTVYDLDRNQESTGVDLAKYKPNPRSITSSFEKASTSLPRCLAVAVLSPWVNAGRYLFDEEDEANPAMIFYYANIVNDTPLGAIPGNDSFSDTDKLTPLSELTKLGHFYNPFADIRDQQRNQSYWTIKMGGPEDEFLTKKAADGVSSYYAGLDFVYIPYLPRFTDTGLVTSSGSQTGMDRITAADLRAKFEGVIKQNNFKIWLDASAKDQFIQEYGLGDLFTESNEYRVQWLQPSLWNDLPEAELGAVHKTENANNTPTDPWTKKSPPLLTTGNGESGWDVDIVRGSRPFSFVKLNTNANATPLAPGATLTGLLYGSHEGIHLQQRLTLFLMRRGDRVPLPMENRTSDQGRLYNAKVTEVGLAGNLTTIKLQLDTNSYNTPKKADGATITWDDLDSIVLSGNGPQYSTKNSLTAATLSDPGNDGVNVTVTKSSNCAFSATLVACPSVGDVVSLNKAGAAPIWGQVTAVSFAGSTMSSFTIDKARRSPKPLRNMAAVPYTDPGGNPMIAYYGGEIVMNDYDAGFNSESDELWLYDPENDVWTYPTQTGSSPGKRAGASLVFDEQNRRLVMFGGFYREGVAVTSPPGQINCETAQAQCLYSNQAGLRLAKRVTNDVYAYTLGSGSWEKINYSFDAAKKIQKNNTYQMRVVSTLADRSGLERWRWTPRADNTNGAPPIVVNINGTASSTIKVTPSAAGIAKGDELYMYSRDPQFNAWGRVTDVDYPNDTVTLVAHGHIRTGATSVTVNELFLQIINRQFAARPCTGDYVASSDLYSCVMSGDTTGYAVGDQVVLEEYQAGKLNNLLSGYISHMEANGAFYFVQDERLGSLEDFRNNTGVGKVAGESAVSFPVGRYGGTLQIKPGDPQGGKQANYLWQGTSTNITNNIRFNEIWELEFNNGVTAGPASAIWASTPKAMNNPAPSTSATYSVKSIKPTYFTQVFTPTNGAKAPEVVKDLVTTNEQTGQQTIEWDNTKTWELTLDTSGLEAGSPSRLVANAPIIIERFNGPDGPNPNVRETFYGTIVGTFANGYDSTVIKIKHNPAYPGDSGLKSHSKNSKISVHGYYRTDYIIGGTATWVQNGGYLKVVNVPASNHHLVPSSGMALMFWRDVNGGYLEAYTMTVRDRTYTAATDEFRFYPDDRPYASPGPLSYGGNGVVSHNGNDAYVLALSEHQLSSYGQGAPEWFANAKENNPEWRIRISDTESAELNDRPAPRQGGAFASYYFKGSFKSQVYYVGGTFGRYADVWKMDHAGKMNGSDDVRWRIGKASPDSNKDLPNLFGSSLQLYEKNGAIKAVHFGGKLKFDTNNNDYNKYLGPKILSKPEIDRYSTSDNSYMLPETAPVDSAGVVGTLQANFPSGVSANVQKVKNSLKLSTTGIAPTSPGGWTLSKTACGYIGQVCDGSSDSPPLLRHLGTLGRHSSNNTAHGGHSWGAARAVLNPGTAFLKEGSQSRLILSGSAMSADATNGRWDQDGYYPYLCDTAGRCSTVPYGTTGTNFASDKTLMFAGFAKITGANQGGAVLVTTTAVGSALVAGRWGSSNTGGRWYGYCAEYYYDDPDEKNGNEDFECKTGATRVMRWLPDSEDLVFLFNASLVLASTDTYRVIGYHGGAKRGYQVIKQPGRDPIVFEIVP